MNAKQEERDRRSLAQRAEMLTRPMVPLRRHGYLRRPETDLYWEWEPRAVGITADNSALALWDHRVHGRAVVRTDADGPLLLEEARAASFVQPLPDGRVLLVDARSRHGGETAEVWDADGHWVRAGHLGDALEHVITTAAGEIWVGYFDEAATSGAGIGGPGLVHFDCM